MGILLVFFAALAYAATLADTSHSELPFLHALRSGLSESLGMLVIGFVAVVVLLLGVIGVLAPSDAV